MIREELLAKLADDGGEEGQEVSVAKEGEEALTEYRSLKSGTSTRKAKHPDTLLAMVTLPSTLLGPWHATFVPKINT